MRTVIMVVDDDEDMRRLVKRVLEEKGATVIEARNGEECLEKLKELKPNIILLDVVMPGISGWDVLRKVKNDDSFKDIKVAMLTSIDPSVEEMMREEFDSLADYILKPSFVEILRKKITALPSLATSKIMHTEVRI